MQLIRYMPDMRKIPDIKNRGAEGKKTPDVPVIPNIDGIPPPPTTQNISADLGNEA